MHLPRRILRGAASLSLLGVLACASASAPAAGERPPETPSREPGQPTATAPASPATPTVAPTAALAGSPTSTPTTAPTSPASNVSAGGVPADSDFEQALRDFYITRSGWETDFRFHTVPYSEIFSGGVPRDGIPPIDQPTFTATASADQWLGPLEPVISLEVNGEARAYPLQIITWHEIVNDEVGGVPVTATFCPLCNSAMVFDRRLAGVVYDFGVSGNLRNSDLIMWDRQTESWWQQFTGEGIVGEMAGQQLTILPATIISWEDFRAAHPQGRVLSRDTGYSRPYGQNPYVGYDEVGNPPFLFRGPLDGRLLPMERVAALRVGGEDAAFPFSALEAKRVVNDTVGGQDLVIFFKPGTRSALDGPVIGKSRQVGATGVFETALADRTLTFRAEGDRFLDNETGSVWSILGEAIEGPLKGQQLAPIVHANHFWFAWGAFRPDTRIYQGS